jgi:hypothetical protein
MAYNSKFRNTSNRKEHREDSGAAATTQPNPDLQKYAEAGFLCDVCGLL